MPQQSAETSAPTPTASLLFLCLARNCEQTIGNLFAFMDSLQEMGFSCNALIGENGSSDGTRTAVVADSPRSQLFDTKFMSQETQRLRRMAIGRQALLDEAQRRGISADFICVADLDSAFAQAPSSEGLCRSLEQLRADPGLFAVGATSSPVYYDLLSLRTADYDSSRLYSDQQQAQGRLFGYYRFHCEQIWSVQSAMTPRAPVRCYSSFNGFCVYKAEDYFGGTYRAADESEVCEHVTFNVGLFAKSSKQMLITTELVIIAPADHTRVGFVHFWLSRLRKKVRAKMRTGARRSAQ